MIEQNLLVQIGVVLVSALSFLIIIEGYGFTVMRLIDWVLKIFGINKTNSDKSFDVVLRFFIGGLFYALVFFFIGLFGLITKQLVVILSVLVPIIIFLVAKRWKGILNFGTFFKEEKWLLFGGLIFLLITFVLWFRPMTNFDGLWYHIPISKIFLQNHSIADQGKLATYSLQPSINYFWNLWPLSLPFSTAIASIVINSTHAFFIVISSIFAAKVGKMIWKWNSIQQLLAPCLVAGTYETFKILGVGGNDGLGLAYGITAALYCFYILQKANVDWRQLIYGILLIVGLASIKLFFSILATLLMAYLIIDSWKQLPLKNNYKKRLLVSGSILVVIFVITYLPWIVRSYLATGRFLDPIGEPEITARIYVYVGSTALDHWTKNIFERFYVTIWPMLTFVYSPLVLLGFLAISSSKLRSKISNLWLLSILGYVITFFASIALSWRYYLPVATIIVFLGVVALFMFIKETWVSLFGKTLVLACALTFFICSIVRVILASPDSSGIPNISHDIYVSHFTSTNNYLSAKLTGSTYDYIQEYVPKDLNPNEKIFIGNAADLVLHNLAYVKNPILENHTDKKLFSGIRTAAQLKDVLSENRVRYVVVRNHKISDICREIGVETYKDCDNPNMFKHELYDKKWNVDWYLLETKFQ